MWIQKEIAIDPKSRGFHLITDEVIMGCPDMQKIEVGIMQVFIKHTSASLTINEDADPTVRADFESHFNQMVPENAPYYQHTFEGSDDMPAHLKSSIFLPIHINKRLLHNVDMP
jgi:secondary thiamine-phosphate synthase enzyme